MSNSTELAANKSLFPVWDPSVPFPSTKDMLDLDIVSHVAIERAKPNGYYYLHEATIMWYRDQFFMGWANHKTRETGDHDELVRGCSSPDGLHWSKPKIWAKAPFVGGTSHNHPMLFTHDNKLYGFFVCWRGEEHRPTTEIYIYNDSTEKWDWQKNSSIPEFLPFCLPQRMANGNWIIGGENYWYDAAVAISDGNDFSKWTMVKIPNPEKLKILYPETAIVNYGNNHLLAICRPYNGKNRLLHIEQPFEMPTAPTSESFDGGKTWTPLTLSNFPLDESKPFSGKLSTGHNYLITNSLEDGRALLSIALTDSEGGLFRHIFKVRHQQWPRRRFFENALGMPTEWSYPNAFEHNGNLYVAYTQGKEDCVLSIIPIEVLNV